MTFAIAPKQQAWLAWGLTAFGAALLLATLLLMLLNNSLSIPVGGYLFVFNAFLPIGWLLTTRRPENSIGWIFLAISITTNLSWVLEEYARMSLVIAPGSLPGGVWAAWFVRPVQPASWILMFTALLLFPTGRPINRWWGIFIWANLIFFEFSSFLAAFTTPFLDYFPDIRSPAYFADLSGLVVVMDSMSGFVNIAAVAITAVLRFRGAGPVEKQQLKWFTYSVVLMVVLPQLAQRVFDIPQSIMDNVSVVIILLPVAAIAIAILRYRLYDIDLIIRRTLVYAALTAMLGLTYWGGVLLLQTFLRPITGEGNDLAIVATTLLVAALFLPLRRVVQGFIDRRFYRRKYDAAHTLAAFGQVARDEVDLQTLTGRLVDVVDDTMQPEHASLWLLPAGGPHAYAPATQEVK